MFFTIKLNKIRCLPALLLTAATLVMLVLFTVNMSRAAPAAASDTARCLVLDPGHGGLDGGAVSKSGKKESDINLAIALKTQKLAEFYGVDTVMTRTDDSMRTDLKSYSEHEDLVRRTEIANSARNGILISIHQNCYPTSLPSGAQTLFSNDPESKKLGELTQSNIVRYLQPENRRLAEPAPAKLYITGHAACPAILVECGFMSNFSDLEKLSGGRYQTSLAVVLFVSYLQYTERALLT